MLKTKSIIKLLNHSQIVHEIVITKGALRMWDGLPCSLIADWLYVVPQVAVDGVRVGGVSDDGGTL